MPIADGALSLTYEPSGEIRLRVTAMDRHGSKRRDRFAARFEAAGCGALVYSRKVREKPQTPAGMGGLPRPTEFGSRGKRMIKNAVGALKALYDKRIVFATVTLPGSTSQARQAICCWSSKAIQLMTHWIRYHAEGSHYCFVWERQKSGALHIHAAIGNNDVLKLRALERGFQEYVHRMFSTISDLSGVDMFARADGGSWRGNVEVLRSNCQPVRKCVKRYMAKYITKGAGAGPAYYPARWWGCSVELRRVVGSLRRCSRRRTADWGSISNLVEKALAAICPLGYTQYEFSCPFSPLSRTILIYPPEHDAVPVFQALDNLLQESYTNLTNVEQFAMRPVSLATLISPRGC